MKYCGPIMGGPNMGERYCVDNPRLRLAVLPPFNYRSSWKPLDVIEISYRDFDYDHAAWWPIKGGAK